MKRTWFHVGQRGGLTLNTFNGTITPPTQLTYPWPRYRQPAPVTRPDVYGYEYWQGEGSTGFWTAMGAAQLPQGYTSLDKMKIGCAILKSHPLPAMTWVRGVLFKEGGIRFNEFENRYSVALQTCTQFGL